MFGFFFHSTFRNYNHVSGSTKQNLILHSNLKIHTEILDPGQTFLYLSILDGENHCLNIIGRYDLARLINRENQRTDIIIHLNREFLNYHHSDLNKGQMIYFRPRDSKNNFINRYLAIRRNFKILSMSIFEESIYRREEFEYRVPEQKDFKTYNFKIPF